VGARWLIWRRMRKERRGNSEVFKESLKDWFDLKVLRVRSQCGWLLPLNRRNHWITLLCYLPPNFIAALHPFSAFTSTHSYSQPISGPIEHIILSSSTYSDRRNGGFCLFLSCLSNLLNSRLSSRLPSGVKGLGPLLTEIKGQGYWG